MAVTGYTFQSLTGGGVGALDIINHSILTGLDLAYGIVGGVNYTYQYSAGSAIAERSPFVIAPDSGTGRWILQSSSNTVILSAETTSRTVIAADLLNNALFTNTGQGGEVVLTLPAGASNYSFSAFVTEAAYLRFVADGAEKFRHLATQGAAGGYIRTNVVGRYVRCAWSGTEWVITEIQGAWNYDA